MKSNKVIHHTGRDGNVYSDVETEIESLRTRATSLETDLGTLETTVAAITVPAAASQAQQETGSATDVYVTPGRQHYHQSAAKAWAKCGTATTINASYNVSSITDGGNGRVIFNLTTAFSSTDYAVVATAHGPGRFAAIDSIINTITASTIPLQVTTDAGSNADPQVGYMMAAFGDQ